MKWRVLRFLLVPLLALLLLGVSPVPAAADVVPSCARLDPSTFFGWSNPDQVERELFASGPATFQPGGAALDATHGYAPPPALRYGSIEAAQPVEVWVCYAGARPGWRVWGPVVMR